MANNGNGFRDDEIVFMNHWDKREKKWIQSVFPKIGGRLRLAHDANETLSITTSIVRYDEETAVVAAIVETIKGAFHGIGMASTERDERIAPAILELAETRSIARSLRFAGYGVEYCSAEEVSHLGNGASPQDEASEPPTEPSTKNRKGGNGKGKDNTNRRISNKQLNYIINLGKDLDMNSKDLDEASVATFGVKLSELSVQDASTFIENLKNGDTVPF
jgi:hypothetical protein